MSESVEYWVNSQGDVRVSVTFYDENGDKTAEAGTPPPDAGSIITADEVVDVVLGSIRTAKDDWEALEAGKVVGVNEAITLQLVQIKELKKLGLSDETARAMISPVEPYVAVPFQVPPGLEYHLSQSYRLTEDQIAKVINQSGA